MSDQPLSPVKQALLAMMELQAELDAVTRARTEPIAIVGMGCRFPGGADTPDRFLAMLDGRVDAVTEVPASRFRASGAARWGAFLERVDEFDAAFFGVSPREADAMDPQQRLLLEVAWEALERGGQVPAELAGSATGVFVGVMNDDYRLLSAALPADQRDAHTATGTGTSFLAGRLSYALGFTGPSLVVDAACSSSLVAVHLACQSLRAGEIRLALAGGVNLMLAPLPAELGARLSALSPEGRCKTFDARADGYARGEGCALVVLKRLSDALEEGDPIVALVRGSAVNQDGRSTGLTAPNVVAQAALIRRALENARVAPERVGYVETHGTGTALGDPIEVAALAEVVGRPRADGSSCVLGAVKTNIGHLEAAAGVAGLVKAAMVLRRGVIPPNLHLRTPNPRLDLAGTSLVLPPDPIPWERGAEPRVAGVSAFGLSGTNAHVVVEEAPVPPTLAGADEPALVPLSAKSEPALRELARRWARELADAPGGSLADVAFTAGARRSHHEHRAAVVARSPGELARALEAFAGGDDLPAVATRRLPRGDRPRVVFVFPGHGSPHAGMARELFEREPAFRDALLACDRALAPRIGTAVVEAIRSGAPASSDAIQPALFTVGVALAALLRSWGVHPDATLGVDLGEVTAAHVAGSLSLDDAARAACSPVATRPPLAAELEARLAAHGPALFVELSPHPTLAPAIEEALRAAGRPGRALSTLWRDEGERTALLATLAALYAEGLAVDFRRLSGAGRRVVALPTYPFQRRRFWIGSTPELAPTPARPDPLFEVVFRSAPLPEAQPVERAPWLVLGDAELAARLAAAFPRHGAGPVTVASLPAAELRGLLERAFPGPLAGGVVVLAGRDLGERGEGVPPACASVAALVKALAEHPFRRAPRLVLATSGALDAGAGEPVSPGQAALWGLGRVVASEHPELRFAAVDLPPGPPSDAALDALAREALGGHAEQVALRGDARLSPTIASWAAVAPTEPVFDPEASYLITGGLGGLGSLVATWIARRGARHLALVGRRPANPSAERTLAAIAAAGAEATILPADVADRVELARALAELDRRLPKLRGVIHAAGVVDPCLLRDLDRARLEAVLAPKVAGAYHLHEATSSRALDFFALFSSSAAWLGMPGQGSYAAANAFLDALAQHRRRIGLPAVSIGWSGWSDLGLLASAPARRFADQMTELGIAATPPAEGLAILGRLLSGDAPPRVLVLPIDEAALGRAPPRLRELLGRSPVTDDLEGASAASLLRRELLALSPRSRMIAALRARVAEEAARVLELAPAEVPADAPMRALGMDSMMAIELRDHLEARLGVPLPATLVWQHPTVIELADHLAELLAPAEPPADAPEPGGDVDDLLAEIEGLSDEQVKKLLAEG